MDMVRPSSVITRDPKYKKRCKSLMKQDSETGEWVLIFRLHT